MFSQWIALRLKVKNGQMEILSSQNAPRNAPQVAGPTMLPGHASLTVMTSMQLCSEGRTLSALLLLIAQARVKKNGDRLFQGIVKLDALVQHLVIIQHGHA